MTSSPYPIDKPLVIYHGGCPDGFTAAWCFWHFSVAADFVPGVYQTPPPDVRGRDVFLVDFSYKRPVVEAMLAEARSVTLIDHHKSAIEDLALLRYHPKMRWFCDLDHSGAMLTWKFLRPHESPPRLLRHIEDRDLWRFALPGTREIQAYVFSFDYTFENWDMLMRTPIMTMQAEGESISRAFLKNMREAVLASVRRMRIGGYDVLTANLPYNMGSEGANWILTNVASCEAALGKESGKESGETSEPFAAYYFDTPTHRKFGLRSLIGDADVSEIAALYGGGGHKHAAGFSVPRDHELATS